MTLRLAPLTQPNPCEQSELRVEATATLPAAGSGAHENRTYDPAPGAMRTQCSGASCRRIRPRPVGGAPTQLRVGRVRSGGVRRRVR
jgi:hypothetical protein